MRSLWLDTTPAPERPALDGDVRVDVAVLGAGITGSTAALLLQQAGSSVAVLEGRRIGAGVTGHSTAKVTSLHGLVYADLVSKHGEEVARAYAEMNQAGLERVASIVAELGIDCDFDRRPNYTYAEPDSERSQIEDEVEIAQKLGLPASYTEKTDLQWPVAAAVRFEEQAQFHPQKYLLGLAAALEAGGTRVYEKTFATGVEGSSPCRVRTSTGGTVEAERVIVATCFPFLDRGLFFARVHPSREYVLTLRVRGAAPQGMYLSTESSTHSIRSHPTAEGDLVILGGESHKTGRADEAERYRSLERWGRERFDVEAVEHRWSTQDNMPVDELPYIGRLTRFSDRIYTATGFQKWGLAKGTAAAMMLADLILGRPNAWTEPFDSLRLNPRRSAKKLVKENSQVGLHFFADRLANRAPVDGLAPGEGRVVGDGLRQTALYRDDAGELHALSARCTHLGCIVAWNSGERTWDCPCHGSRFGVDGEVLQGPAVAPLERRDP